MTPKLVIFDCDGVLVDSEPITNDILRRNLAARGLSLTLEQITQMFVGGTMKGVGEKAAEMGANIREGWLDEIYADMYASLAKSTPLIKGILPVLDALDDVGIPYAVGSNGTEQKMEITIGQHPKLWNRLKGRLFSAHVHAKPKPAPDLYLFAAKAMGVAPEHCVVIDDSPSGCLGAINAEIRCFGFAEHDDGTRLAAVGATVFHSMTELPNLLNITP